MSRTRRKTKWLCQRQSKGKKCLTLNPIRAQKCSACGKPKPKPKRPQHMAALNESYEHYIQIQGGEFCGICGKGPELNRRLDRDHAHTTSGLGEPRGLLCRGDNMKMQYWMTVEWMEAALEYLRAHEARMRGLAETITDDDWEA